MRKLTAFSGLALVTLASVATLGTAGPAAAATAPAVSASQVRPLNAFGCNGAVCITVTGSARFGYSSVGQGSGFFGHIQVFGPNLQTTGSEANNPVASGNGIGAGQTCAVAWQATAGGGHVQVGKACETVS